MEMEFIDLQDQLRRSEVTEVDNGAGGKQLHYNGFSASIEYGHHLDQNRE